LTIIAMALRERHRFTVSHAIDRSFILSFSHSLIHPSHALDKPARGRHRVYRLHTHVFPKSRAPSSPPLELRRTTETPRLAVFVTEVVTVRVVVIFC